MVSDGVTGKPVAGAVVAITATAGHTGYYGPSRTHRAIQDPEGDRRPLPVISVFGPGYEVVSSPSVSAMAATRSTSSLAVTGLLQPGGDDRGLQWPRLSRLRFAARALRSTSARDGLGSSTGDDLATPTNVMSRSSSWSSSPRPVTNWSAFSWTSSNTCGDAASSSPGEYRIETRSTARTGRPPARALHPR